MCYKIPTSIDSKPYDYQLYGFKYSYVMQIIFNKKCVISHLLWNIISYLKLYSYSKHSYYTGILDN